LGRQHGAVYPVVEVALSGAIGSTMADTGRRLDEALDALQAELEQANVPSLAVIPRKLADLATSSPSNVATSEHYRWLKTRCRAYLPKTPLARSY